MATPARPSRLIVGEVGRRVSNRACADLLFDVIDRRHEREGPNTMTLTSNMAPSSWDEFLTGDEALPCALDRASVLVMRGPGYRGRGLDTHSVEAVPQATKVRGMQPKGVQPLHKLGNRLPAHWPESADRDWRLSPDWMWLNSSGANNGYLGGAFCSINPAQIGFGWTDSDEDKRDIESLVESFKAWPWITDEGAEASQAY